MSFTKSHYKNPILLILTIGYLFASTECWALATGTDLDTELTAVNSIITGGYLRFAIFLACGGAIVHGAIKQNPGQIALGLGAATVVFLLRGWIDNNFAMII